jgi:hypothetical protein
MRVFLIFMLLLLAITAPASAQIIPYCGQLSEADCALMRDGQQSLLALRSAALNNAAFTIVSAGDGVHIAISAQGKVTQLPIIRSHAPLVLKGLRAELTLSWVSSGTNREWRDVAAFESVNVRLIDGVMYMDLDSLEPPLSDPLWQGWVSYDLKAQDPRLFGAEPLPTPNPNIQTHESPLNGVDLERLAAAFSPDVLDRFVIVARAGDVFETRMDFPTMYADPDVRDVLREQLPDIWWRYHPATQGPVSDADLDRLAATVAAFYPEPVVLYGWSVDPVTRLAQSFRYWQPWDFNQMVEAAVFPNDREMPTSQLQFWLSAEFDGYNEPVEIAAPLDARPLTQEETFQLLTILFPVIASRSAPAGADNS